EVAPDLGRRLTQAFDQGSGHGLLWLGADAIGLALPPVLSYWRDFAARYVAALCALPGIAEGRGKPPVASLSLDELTALATAAPPMTGAEYLSAEVLSKLWREIDAAFDAELAAAKLPVQDFLKGR